MRSEYKLGEWEYSRVIHFKIPKGVLNAIHGAKPTQIVPRPVKRTWTAYEWSLLPPSCQHWPGGLEPRLIKINSMRGLTTAMSRKERAAAVGWKGGRMMVVWERKERCQPVSQERFDIVRVNKGRGVRKDSIRWSNADKFIWYLRHEQLGM